MRFLACISLILLIYQGHVKAQCALYEVGIDQKIEMSSLVVEGQVRAVRSFWNPEKTLIYSAHQIEVSKVFKGAQAPTKIELISRGGELDEQLHEVNPSLHPNIGESGIFFLQASDLIYPASDLPEALHFQAYASVQGFIRYDPLLGTAHDQFHHFSDINQELYPLLIRQTGQAFHEVKTYQAPRPYQAISNPRTTPGVTSFSPDTLRAGVGDVLTINGNCFGTFLSGTSAVFFRNADDGGATFVGAADVQVLTWTNTQITVEVPSRGGTGTFVVQNDLGNTGFSATDLTVQFNHTNITSAGAPRVPQLADDNGTGGYDFVYSTNTSNNGVSFSGSAGQSPFEDALATWQCGTLFNINADGTTTSSNTVAPNDAENIVMFDNDASPLPAGVLGRATSGFGTCGGIILHVNGFDVEFRRDGTGGVTWNFGPGATTACCFDFESVSVHEVGHCHMLGHIIASGKVMHFSITNGSDVRSLDAFADVPGGSFVMSNSASLSSCGGSVTGISNFPCMPLAIDWQLEGRHKDSFNEITSYIYSDEPLVQVFLEKRMAQGFEQIHHFEAHCPNSCVLSHQDFQLTGPGSIYRMVGVDQNGHQHFSNQIQIAHEDLESSLHWYGDAEKNEIQFWVNGPELSDIQAALIFPNGTIGAIKYEKTKPNNWHFSTAHLPIGICLLRLQDQQSGQDFSTKILIQSR